MPDHLTMIRYVLENLNSLKSVQLIIAQCGLNGQIGLNVQPLVEVGCRKESETAFCPKTLEVMIMGVWVNLGK